MKIEKFNVVELKDGNRATILNIHKNGYLAEIVSPYGITLKSEVITDKDIQKVVYARNNY